MATKPTKNIKLKTDKTGKTTVETTAPKRSLPQKIAARKKPKQKVVRRTVK